MKFKVGDKVRVLEEDSLYFGRIGLVSQVCIDNVYPYKVSVDEGYGGIVYEEQYLELIEEPKESLLDELRKYKYPKPIITFSDKESKPSIIKIKDERLNKLKQLIKAVNTLGEFGKEVELKITIELDGKKIEL